MSYKTTVTIPKWAESRLWAGSSVNSPAGAYDNIGLLHRAIDLRVNSLLRIPVYFYSLEGSELESYPFEEEFPFSDFLRSIEIALLIWGKSYTLELQAESGETLGLQFLNPDTINKIKQGDQYKYWQFVNGKRFPEKKEFWSAEEIFILHEFSPFDDSDATSSCAKRALSGVVTKYNMTEFLKLFLERGGVPVTLLTVENGESDDPQMKSLEAWFRSVINRAKKYIPVMAINKSVKVEQFTPEVKSFQIDKIDAQTVADTADAFGIPQTLLRSNSANRATAYAERESFYNDTVIPRAMWLQGEINRWARAHDFRIEFAPQELPELQEDEAQRATAFGVYYKVFAEAGVEKSVQLAAAIMGVNIPEDYQDFWTTEYVAPQVAQGQFPPLALIAGGKSDIEKDLKAWRTKAINRFLDGRSPQVSFKSQYISQSLNDEIFERLGTARSVDDIKNIIRVEERDFFVQAARKSGKREAVRLAHEKRMVTLLNRWFEDVKNSAVAHVRKSEFKTITTLRGFDVEMWIEKLFPLLRKEFLDAMRAGFQLFVRQHSLDGIVWVQNDARVTQVINDLSKKTRTIAEGFEEELTRQIDQGVSLRESADQLAERVSQFFDDQVDFRSRRIAITTSNTAMNKGNDIAAKDSGFKFKTWVTYRDDRVRDGHKDLDGVKIAIDEKFFDAETGDSLEFPGDPSAIDVRSVVNCRCNLVYS